MGDGGGGDGDGGGGYNCNRGGVGDGGGGDIPPRQGQPGRVSQTLMASATPNQRHDWLRERGPAPLTQSLMNDELREANPQTTQPHAECNNVPRERHAH